MHFSKTLPVVAFLLMLIFPPVFEVNGWGSRPRGIFHWARDTLPCTGLAKSLTILMTNITQITLEIQEAPLYSLVYRLTVGALQKIPPNEFKVLVTFVLSYPLAFLAKQIPRSQRAGRNAYVIAVGLTYLRFVFGDMSAVSAMFISSTAVYLIAKRIRGPNMPWIALGFLMTHLSLLHLARFRGHQNGYFICVNVTQTQMVLVIKLSAFCWSLHDGRALQKILTSLQKERAIVKMPDVLDYAGYILFFPNLLTEGFEYVHYHKWVDQSMFDQAGDNLELQKTPCAGSIPSCTKSAFLKAVSGLFYTLLFINLSTIYPVGFLLDIRYSRYGLGHRIWILHTTAFWCRARSYALWAFSEGAIIMCGMGYRSVDSVTKVIHWDRMQNVNPLGVELAQNSKAFIGNWNTSTQSWLRDYVYLRVTPGGQRPGARDKLITFVFSALWHGFYPGYYITFLFVGILDMVAKEIRCQVRPHVLAMSKTNPSVKTVYDVLSWIVTQLAFDFAVVPFLVLDVTASISVWSSLRFYGIAAVVVGLLLRSSKESRIIHRLASLSNRKLVQASIFSQWSPGVKQAKLRSL